MPKHSLSENEKDILKVLKSELDYAKDTPSLADTKNVLDANISDSEELLRSIGYGDELNQLEVTAEPQICFPMQMNVIRRTLVLRTY